MDIIKTKFIVIATMYIFYWMATLPAAHCENRTKDKTSIVYHNITHQDRYPAKLTSEKFKVYMRDDNHNKPLSITIPQSNRRLTIDSRKLNECDRNCRRNDNEENCNVKCDYETKLGNTIKLESASKTNSINKSKLLSNGQSNDDKDKILEIEESITASDSIHNNDNEYRTKDAPKTKNDKMEKYLKNIISLKSRTTTKVFERKTSRTSTQKTKTTIYRGRIRYSPSSARIREERLSPFVSTFKYSNFSSIFTSSITTSSPSQSKMKDFELMEALDSKQSSTEKTKFLKSRNIVAINNYVKRFNSRITITPKIIPNQSDSTPSLTFPMIYTIESTTSGYLMPQRTSTAIIPATKVQDDVSTKKFKDNFISLSSTPDGNKMNFFDYSTRTLNASFISSSEMPTIKTTKRIYNSIPRRKQSSTYLTTPRAIISIILNNTKISNQNSTSLKIPMISTTEATTLSYIDKNDTSTEVPIELKVLPSISSDGYTTSSLRPHVLYESISTTSINDATNIEAQKLNITVYGLGGFCFLPVILALLYFVKSYIMKRKENDEYNDNDIQPITPVITSNNSDDFVYFDESNESFGTFNRNKLRFKSLLGEGNFGQVWKAEIDNINGSSKIVAVKTERINNGLSGLKSECNIMQKLGSHPNVVTLIAACVEQEPHLLIMEFAMRGRLLSLLRTARSVSNGLHNNTQNYLPVMPLSPKRLTGFAHDIAKGMEYIANKKIVHCDLAARNILLDHNGICKICDFGMSIDLDKMETQDKCNQVKIPRVSTQQKKFKFDMTARVFDGIKNYAFRQARSSCGVKNRPAMPVRWMAPESLQYHIYSIETDVFSFGILLWEIVTLGITPYPELSGREVIRGVLNGIRPEIPINCKQGLSDIMKRCWQKISSQRPSFFDIKKSLASTLLHWKEESSPTHTEYLDVSGFSEDYENGMIYFNRRISEFECEI